MAIDKFLVSIDEKVKTITDETVVDNSVYNGTTKIRAGDQMFMGSEEVEICIRSIKMKGPK